MTRARAQHWRPETHDVEAIVEGRHGDPFAVLGSHRLRDDAWCVRVFAPDADCVAVVALDGETFADLDRIDERGFFAGLIKHTDLLPYRLHLRRGSHSWSIEDTYRFTSTFGDLDLHLLAEGLHQRIYERLGAHPMSIDGVDGTRFAVWAPNAQRVSVVGDFNAWDGRRNPMRKRHEAGVWELFEPGVRPGAFYKFEILGADGILQPLKADPVSFSQELPPATASRVYGLPARNWTDAEWIDRRAERQARDRPISIYEVHLGSWRRGENNAFVDYLRLATELAGYVSDLGFTHVELLPVSEHPFSGSWGYQPVGLFAPTSRFGGPEGFRRFVEILHEANIGVLLDWVPAHFPNDAHGLVRFDGTALYEHEDPRLGVHRDWNTLIYNFGRREVSNFLASNATFWLEHFHLDGLRVDAVASMLYLDYSREPGQWMPNVHGGRENLEAVAFLKRMNRDATSAAPGTITIAEESTAWPGVSHPSESGGLGFSYKWNMGWMHDTLRYMANDPIHRRHHHSDLTFGLLYAFSENFILPLSHDEVVHGKGSLIGKMPGDRWQRFANLRAYFGFMWTHPGKKLLFMGGEFAQQREWNHDRGLDWNHLSDPMHRGVQNLVRDLNALYRDTPALYERDCEADGFAWIVGDDADQSVIAFERMARGGEPAVVICNFTPVVRHRYRVGISRPGRWHERLNTDSLVYGGSNVGNGGGVDTYDLPMHGRTACVELTLPPLATVVLTPVTP